MSEKLEQFHAINPLDDTEAAIEYGKIVAEWSDMSDAPLHDIKLLSILSQATKTRFENDEAVVQSMLDKGVDPEIAFDKTTNQTIWALALMYTAYSLGRGLDAAPVVEEFADHVDTLFKED